MNKIKRTLSFSVFALLFAANLNFAQVTNDDYKVLNFTTNIKDGKPLEKNILLKGGSKVVANVTLRNGEALGTHTEQNAFWLIATAGSGELILGKNKTIDLKPGVMVTVKPGIPHDVVAKTDLSILVIKFMSRKKDMKHPLHPTKIK